MPSGRLPAGRAGRRHGTTRERHEGRSGRRGHGARPHHGVVLLVGALAYVVLAITDVPVGPGTSAPGPPAGGSGSVTAPARTGGTAHGSTPPTSAASTPKRGPLTLVGLGDSVPAATTCDCNGFVELLGTRLAALTGRHWAVHNDANSGWTTADVEGDLQAAPTRDDLGRADLVVVDVGANDFDLDRVDDPHCLPASTSGCWSATLQGLRDGLTRIITAIRHLDARPDLRVAVLGYWNVTVDGAVGTALGEDFVLGSDALTRLVNSTVAAVASSTGALYVDAYTPLKGVDGTRDPTGDLLDDGDHPNASGHTLLTTAVVDSLEHAGAVTAWRRS
jgi:lysophospholipase L1-like esterase